MHGWYHVNLLNWTASSVAYTTKQIHIWSNIMLLCHSFSLFLLDKFLMGVNQSYMYDPYWQQYLNNYGMLGGVGTPIYDVLQQVLIWSPETKHLYRIYTSASNVVSMEQELLRVSQRFHVFEWCLQWSIQSATDVSTAAVLLYSTAEPAAEPKLQSILLFCSAILLLLASKQKVHQCAVLEWPKWNVSLVKQHTLIPLFLFWININ